MEKSEFNAENQLGDETAEKPNKNNERAQFSPQRKSLPHPQPELGRQREGISGFWARPEAGNMVALCSRSKELLAETGLRQKEEKYSGFNPTPPINLLPAPLANLAGSQMSQKPCTRSLQVVGTELAEQGKGAEADKACWPGPT